MVFNTRIWQKLSISSFPFLHPREGGRGNSICALSLSTLSGQMYISSSLGISIMILWFLLQGHLTGCLQSHWEEPFLTAAGALFLTLFNRLLWDQSSMPSLPPDWIAAIFLIKPRTSMGPPLPSWLCSYEDVSNTSSCPGEKKIRNTELLLHCCPESCNKLPNSNLRSSWPHL